MPRPRRRSRGTRSRSPHRRVALEQAAPRAISAGSISGSSPCTLTTIVVGASPSSCGRFGEAVGAGRVVGARHDRVEAVRARRQRDARVVGGDDDARARRLPRARSATRTTIGLPRDVGERLARQARRRVARRDEDRERVGRSALTSRSFPFLGRELARLVLEHHRNAVADRIGEPVRLRDELLRARGRRSSGPLRDRAHEDLKQLGIHEFVHDQCDERAVERARTGRYQQRVVGECARILPRPSRSSGSRARAGELESAAMKR